MNQPIAQVQVPAVLRRAGWRWTTHGLEICFITDQGSKRVLMPLGHVEVIFHQELAKVGCPTLPQVGAPGTCEGFLASVGAAHSQALEDFGGDYDDDDDDDDFPAVGGRRRRARKAARRARRRAKVGEERWAKKLRRRRRRRKFFRGVTKAVKKVGNIAKKVVTNPVFRAGFAALATAVPILAPAAAGLEVASRVIKKIDKGAKAAKAIARGFKGRENQKAVAEARRARQGIRTMRELAKGGNRQAQRAMGALVGAKATQLIARGR